MRAYRPWLAITLGVVVLVFWQLISVSGAVAEYFLPAPTHIIDSLITSIRHANMLGYAWVTLREAILGCMLAFAGALPLALALFHWPLFSQTVLPYVAASQAIPAIAIAPLLVLWVGYGLFPVVLLCAFMVFFPITISILLGLRSINRDVIEAARLDGAGGFKMIIYMELPLATPAILAGLRTGMSICHHRGVVSYGHYFARFDSCLRKAFAHNRRNSKLGNTMISRRQAVSLLGLAAGGVALGACSSGTASKSKTGAQPLTIGLTYTPNIQFAPFYLAQANKQYADSVKLRHHGAQEGLFDALSAGSEDLVIAGADEAAVACSNGSNLVVVGGYYHSYAVCIMVPANSSITSLAQLRGKKIGTPGTYGENWFGLLLALRSAGLSQNDVNIMSIGYTQQAALMSGKVDAIVGYSNNDAVALEESGMKVRKLAVATNPPLIGASLVTSTKALAAKRDALKAAVAASVKGMQTFVTDPDAAVKAAVKYVPDLADAKQAAKARKVAVATAELIKPSGLSADQIGKIGASEVEAMIKFLSELKVFGSKPVTREKLLDALI